MISIRGRLGIFWRLKEFFKDETKDDMVVIRGFIEPIVQAAIRKKGGNADGNEPSLLHHLVHVMDGTQLSAYQTAFSFL